jgi:hypothetical protein
VTEAWKGLFVPPHIHGHVFGGDVFGVVVEEQDIAAVAMAGAGKERNLPPVNDQYIRTGDECRSAHTDWFGNGGGSVSDKGHFRVGAVAKIALTIQGIFRIIHHTAGRQVVGIFPGGVCIVVR